MKIFSLFFLSLTLTSAHASPSGKRLIELSETKRVWMDEREIFKLKSYFHETVGICGGFMDVTDHASQRALPILRKLVSRNRSVTENELVRQLLPRLQTGSLLSFVENLSKFQNRYYKSKHGVAAAEAIAAQYKAMSAGRSDVEVLLFKHRFDQSSVIVRIKGATKPTEKVILGAHLDSINGRSSNPEARAPGADDDGSGTATLMEIFRVITASGTRPERTLEFMGYAGEEAGLLGSQDIAADYKKRGEKVAAVLQLDMTLYPGTKHTMTFITDHVDRELTEFTEKLAATYVAAPTQRDRCGYACSDHASWNKAGYASVFPFEALMSEDNKQIHTERDTIENGLDPEFGLRFAKLGLAFAVELAYGN